MDQQPTVSPESVLQESGFMQRADGTWCRKKDHYAPQLFKVYYKASETIAEAFAGLKPKDIFRNCRVLRNEPPEGDKEGCLVVECERVHADEFTQFLHELDRKAAETQGDRHVSP